MFISAALENWCVRWEWRPLLCSLNDNLLPLWSSCRRGHGIDAVKSPGLSDWWCFDRNGWNRVAMKWRINLRWADSWFHIYTLQLAAGRTCDVRTCVCVHLAWQNPQKTSGCGGNEWNGWQHRHWTLICLSSTIRPVGVCVHACACVCVCVLSHCDVCLTRPFERDNKKHSNQLMGI